VIAAALEERNQPCEYVSDPLQEEKTDLTERHYNAEFAGFNSYAAHEVFIKVHYLY
jgi:hypothetical protein